MIYEENLKIYSDYAIGGILDLEFTEGEGRHGRLTLRGSLAEDGTFTAKEEAKQLRLHADSLGFAGGCSDRGQQAVLGADSLCLCAGEGKFILRSGKGIYIEAPALPYERLLPSTNTERDRMEKEKGILP